MDVMLTEKPVSGIAIDFGSLRIMRKLKKFIFIFLIFVTAIVSAESYKNIEDYKDTEGYKGYLQLPESYHSPEAERMYKEGFEAQKKVENLPCKLGGTVNECLDKKASIPAIEDLGWITRPYQGGFEVEREMILSNHLILKYRWDVSADGRVTAINGYAIGLDPNQ